MKNTRVDIFTESTIHPVARNRTHPLLNTSGVMEIRDNNRKETHFTFILEVF